VDIIIIDMFLSARAQNNIQLLYENLIYKWTKEKIIKMCDYTPSTSQSAVFTNWSGQPLDKMSSLESLLSQPVDHLMIW